MTALFSRYDSLWSLGDEFYLLTAQQVYRDSQHFYTVEHDPPRPVDTQTNGSPPTSPGSRSQSGDTKQISFPLTPNQWSSPAFSRRGRQSLGPLSISTFDPFAEEDGYVAGKGRKRTRFSRLSSEWRFAETSPSPTKTTASDPFEELDTEIRKSEDSETAVPEAGQVDESIPDGVPDGTEIEASLTSVADTDIVEDTTERSRVLDTNITSFQNITTPKIVVQSEEQQDGAVAQAATSKATLEAAEWRLDASEETSGELGAAISYSVSEAAPLLAIDDTSTAEPVAAEAPENHAIDTPRLRPVDSPGLPLVSPLNTRSGTPIDHFNESQSVPADHATEDSNLTASQDLDLMEVDIDNNEQSISQESREAPELSVAVDASTAFYDKHAAHVADDGISQASDAEQSSEAAVEDSISPGPPVTIEATESISFGEQQFGQTLQETGSDLVGTGVYEREESGASSDSEDENRYIEVNEEERLGGDIAESETTSESIEEYSVEDDDEAENDQEGVESDEDLPNVKDESPVLDGEYELDDIPPSAGPQAQPTAVSTRHEVIVLESDDETPPDAGNEDIEQGEMEGYMTDSEERSEEDDNESTGLPDERNVSQHYTSEAEDAMAIYKSAEPGRETKDSTDVHRGEVVEPVLEYQENIAEPNLAPSSDVSEEQGEYARESNYRGSPSFSPPTRDGSISGRESIREEVLDPELFLTQDAKPSQTSPQKKQQPSALSLDGPSSPPPPEGPRQNPLFGVRSPSFLKNQPSTPLGSQERASSPSQQLYFSPGAPPTLPTPEASQEVTALHAHQDSTLTEKRGLNESGIENGINIFNVSHLQNFTDTSEGKLEAGTHIEEESQYKQEVKPETRIRTENDSQVDAESLNDADIQSAKDSELEVPEEPYVPKHELETNTQPKGDSELVVESETDVSASQPEASTSPETTLVPEISGDTHKPGERLVQNGEQESIENDETSPTKDNSLREPIDPAFLSPYPAKAPEIEPNRHATGLRTDLSYYAPLSTLVNNFNTLTDTLSIVISATSPLRATSGPRDYHTTIQVTDRSLAGRTTSAQIFRRYKRAIPRPAEGDVILLRNFKVCAFNHTMMLQTVNSSSWAVFDQGKPDAMRVTGPPVEVGDEERNYVMELRKSYTDGIIAASDRGSIPTSRASTGTFSTASSESGAGENRTRGGSTPRRSRQGRSSRSRRITIHELRHGRRYTDVGSGSDKDSIHELRDGTVYMNP